MKRLITLILLGYFSTLVFAAQGGRPIKLESYDYHDYVNSEIQAKTFNRRDNGGYFTTATWTYYRPSPGELIITKILTDGAGSIFSWVDDQIYLTNESYSWYGSIIYDVTGEPVATRENIPAIVRMTNNMVPGIAWGTAGVIERDYIFDNHFIDKSELLGIEDVVVPAGTYTDCLKIYRSHDYGYLNVRIDWVCPNLGLVKRVHSNRSIELTDVTFEE